MTTTVRELASVLPYFPSKDLSTFRVDSLLGGGGFSHVVLARDPDGAEWALKLIPAPNATCLDDVDATPMLLSEARIHLLLSEEPSVLPCKEAFKSVYLAEGDGTKIATYMAALKMPIAACSVEEWLFSATPMRSACGNARMQLDEREVLSVWMQMVNAVYRCHSHGVVHKDVKLPNFLMDHRGKVQIMDFGLAQVDGIMPRTVAGTPWTMSPAGFKHSDDGRAGDWWSLGVVLYQLLQGGSWPFKQCWWPWQKAGGDRMEAAIRRAVLAGRIVFRDGAHVSEPAKVLIRGLLQPDPNRRWQLRQVLACEVVTPDLLSGISERFPELGPDMEMLLQLQRRARDVQALGSDGGAAAGVAGAAPVAAAAAALRRRAAAVVAAAADGGLAGLHWSQRPTWAIHGVAGMDDNSYEPLLGEEDAQQQQHHHQQYQQHQQRPHDGRMRSSLETLPDANTVSRLGPSKLSRGGVNPAARLPALPPASYAQHQQDPQLHQQPSDRPQTTSVTLMEGVLEDFAASPRISGAGVAPPHRESRGDRNPHAPHAPVVAAYPVSGSLRRAVTVSCAVSSARESPRHGDGALYETEVPEEDDEVGSPSSQSQPTHRSLTSPQELRPSHLPLHTHLSSPRVRGSYTSLQDLFGGSTLPHALAPAGSLLGMPHPHPHVPQQCQTSGGGAIGNLLGSAVDLLTAGAGHKGGGSHRGSWGLKRDSLLQIGGLNEGGRKRSQGGNSFTVEELTLLPVSQSSWVPPPPEAFAAGVPRQRSGAGSVTQLSPGRRSLSSQLSPASRKSSPRATPSQGMVNSGSLSTRERSTEAWGVSGPGLKPPRNRLVACARKIMAHCLQRPGVKFETQVSEREEYNTLAWNR